MDANSAISAILAVFSAIGSWFVTTIGDISALFYVAGEGLTLLGTLGVCGLGVAIILLVVGLIRGFLRFR